LNSTRSVIEATNIADILLENSRIDDFCGYDPFDGLNSKIFSKMGLNNFPIGRIAWLQFHKRSFVNFRKLAGIEKARNPKGIALFILGMMERRRSSPQKNELDLAVSLGDWLLAESADKGVWKHYAWGYHFDWAARAFYVPRGTPNAITTCYVSRALYKLSEATGESRFADAAIDSGFFLDGLYQHTSSADYYGYIPGETAFVHNASLWSAALVAQAATHTGDLRMSERALKVARQSVGMQKIDGAWAYGTRSHHGFIDGFHTGYNLEALDSLRNTLGTDEFDEAIAKGMNYYRQHFFLHDGTVKYYHDRIWPLDTHSVAQALVTLVKVGRTKEDFARAELVLSRAYATLYSAPGERFVYQKGRWFANKINYLRWTQAWAFYALSLYTANMSTRLRENLL
jgi:polysaccharide biosynthesis protein VpsJ